MNSDEGGRDERGCYAEATRILSQRLIMVSRQLLRFYHYDFVNDSLKLFF